MIVKIKKRKSLIILGITCSMCAFCFTAFSAVTTKQITQKFDKHYGQVEVGGRTVGIEFHRSWPTPSRISFYYPVANSIEFSNDYWKRYESMPFDIKLKVGDKETQLGRDPYTYEYVPYAVNFSKDFEGYNVDFDYNFGDTLPIAVMKINIQNTSKETQTFDLDMALKTSIHTCHTYTLLTKADVSCSNDNTVCITDFNGNKDADNVAVFIANAGMKPTAFNSKTGKEVSDPVTAYSYKKELNPGQKMTVIWLIGQSKHDEVTAIVEKSLKNWKTDVKALEKRVLDFVNIDNFKINDPTLMETGWWSKAEVASLSHYIDGEYISMPCPAEYNFFFTHDLLVTGLGVVLFDPGFVKHGFEFLLKHYDKKNNILEHAYYWKDGKYVTEYVSPSHWNNLWFIISASSYLKHTNDITTVKKLFPIMTVSMNRILTSVEKDGLVHARYPDWWDAGNVYGARAYVTILAYRSLQDYVYTALTIGDAGKNLTEYLVTAQKMKQALVDKLWDKDKKYLMNQLIAKDGTMDEHYYIGSLLAPAYGALDKEKSKELLDTTEKELLDKKLGVRVAMPMDFEKLEKVYKFVNHEEGMPGYYFNGAIWPQGNIWYAVALIANGQLNKAEEVIKKYITIEGIKNSPNGQPSFYETRITADSKLYGQIDKPSFLWQGGWYFYILYQLAGMRENPWNISFVPEMPDSFNDVSYKVTLHGNLCNVKNNGTGEYFKHIEVDGKAVNSAVVTGPAKEMILTRGIPQQPYLAQAECIVKEVNYADNKLDIKVEVVKGQQVDVTVVSPFEIVQAVVNGVPANKAFVASKVNGAYTYSFNFEASESNTIVTFQFK